jgi:choline dehydrogenase-like flavoprotein
MSGATFRPSDVVDFVVIGAGSAGGVMAKELSTAGFRVVVLEQGPYLNEKDYKHDEIRYTYQPGLTNDTKVQPITYRKNESEHAKPAKAIMYGRQVGGGSVHFTANYWRFHESDFEERSQFGEVPGADLADWPIKYADLEPYYTKAEYDLGISGIGGANPFEGPRSKPYPLPPMPVKSSGVLFDRAAKKLGLHPYPAPMAILSQPYQGRAACVHCGFCEYFGCEMRAKSSTLVSVIPIAEKTGRCEVRPNSYVRKIEIDAHGRATGATYFDADRREVFQRAKAVVLCANGAETARLLLLSKSKRFPQGLANSSGLVGTHLMWDSGGVAMGTSAERVQRHSGDESASRLLPRRSEARLLRRRRSRCSLQLLPGELRAHRNAAGRAEMGRRIQEDAQPVLHPHDDGPGAHQFPAPTAKQYFARPEFEGCLGIARHARHLRFPFRRR